MGIDPKLFEQAARAFNCIEVTKGQVVSIATCDHEGRPNVAPIGSMRVIDPNTVHVLQGFLPRTLKNLEHNPLAAFSVTLRKSVIAELAGAIRKRDDEPLGYRLYGQLLGIDDNRDNVRAETREIVKQVPWFVRKPFASFCERNLRRLLTFGILDIRTT